jgi:hypothetical protein
MKSETKFIGSFYGLNGKRGEEIFTITSIATTTRKNKKGKAYITSDRVRCWGWYATLVEAKHAVAINAADMHEMEYTYVVIEKCPSGIPPFSKVVAWYEFTGKYPTGKAWRQCKAPEWSKSICNWGI